MALGTLEGVGNEAVSSNFELVNFAFPRLSSKSVRQIKNRIRVGYIKLALDTYIERRIYKSGAGYRMTQHWELDVQIRLKPMHQSINRARI